MSRVLHDAQGRPVVAVDLETGVSTLGAPGKAASVVGLDEDGVPTVRLDTATAALFLGNPTHPGRVIVLGEAGLVHTLDGVSGAAFVGGAGTPGSVLVRDVQGAATVSLDGRSGVVVAGTVGVGGVLLARDAQARPAARLDGDAATIQAGVQGHAGQIRVMDHDGDAAVSLDAHGATLPASGVAEGFVTRAPAGTVLVATDGDQPQPCARAADPRVIGVVTVTPAVSLGVGRLTRPVVLCGRAWCKVDADLGAVTVGDRLVTSPTPGHAMRADAPPAGTLLGKALQPLDAGQRSILILVTLG